MISVRLLELRSYPGALVHWTQAFGSDARHVVDARHSHESKERDDALDPYQRLADISNSRDGGDFQPYNRAEDEEVSDIVRSFYRVSTPTSHQIPDLCETVSG